MTKLLSSIFIICVLSMAACNSHSENAVTAADTVKQDVLKEPKVQPADTAATVNKVPQTLAAKGDSVIISDSVLIALEPVKIKVNIQTAGELSGSLITAKKAANLRFNQVIKDGGSEDGPFGKTFTYLVTSPGDYTVIVGSSLMAEQPYTGKFTVVLRLK